MREGVGSGLLDGMDNATVRLGIWIFEFDLERAKRDEARLQEARESLVLVEEWQPITER